MAKIIIIKIADRLPVAAMYPFPPGVGGRVDASATNNDIIESELYIYMIMNVNQY